MTLRLTIWVPFAGWVPLPLRLTIECPAVRR